MTLDDQDQLQVLYRLSSANTYRQTYDSWRHWVLAMDDPAAEQRMDPQSATIGSYAVEEEDSRLRYG